ncbi:MAG: polyphenol oxidase family protein [Lachnospiraceae bacterium]|nr:polyphenol oxidase family protein [Lachnospiraceae bacterium]
MRYQKIELGDPGEIIAGYTAECNGNWGNNEPEDLKNYELLGDELGIDTDRMIRIRQKHTDNIACVTAADGGAGIIRESLEGFYDAMITRESGLLLCVVTADCTPVWLYDPVKRALALIHSGREGTKLKIAAKALRLMQDRYGTKAQDIKAAMGPALSKKHHEVQEKDLEGFDEYFSKEEQARFISTNERGRFNIDMETAIRISLERAGVEGRNIHAGGICTYESKDLYSWRRDHDPRKRILSFGALG